MIASQPRPTPSYTFISTFKYIKLKVTCSSLVPIQSMTCSSCVPIQSHQIRTKLEHANIFSSRPKLHQPNSGLVASFSLEILDKYGMYLHKCCTPDSTIATKTKSLLQSVDVLFTKYNELKVFDADTPFICHVTNEIPQLMSQLIDIPRRKYTSTYSSIAVKRTLPLGMLQIHYKYTK